MPSIMAWRLLRSTVTVENMFTCSPFFFHVLQYLRARVPPTSEDRRLAVQSFLARADQPRASKVLSTQMYIKCTAEGKCGK